MKWNGGAIYSYHHWNGAIRGFMWTHVVVENEKVNWQDTILFGGGRKVGEWNATKRNTTNIIHWEFWKCLFWCDGCCILIVYIILHFMHRFYRVQYRLQSYYCTAPLRLLSYRQFHTHITHVVLYLLENSLDRTYWIIHVYNLRISSFEYFNFSSSSTVQLL